jgi:hypothetical protein
VLRHADSSAVWLDARTASPRSASYQVDVGACNSDPLSIAQGSADPFSFVVAFWTRPLQGNAAASCLLAWVSGLQTPMPVYALASRTRGAGSPVLDGPGSLSHHASENPSSSGECHLRALSANGSMSTHSLSVRPTQELSIRSFQRDWPWGLLAALQIQHAAHLTFPTASAR